MARIESLGEYFPFTNARRERVRKKRSPLRSFGELVESSRADTAESSLPGGEVFDSTIEELLDEVQEAGDRLIHSVLTATIDRYRDAVRRFLRLALTGLHVAEEHESGRNVLKRKRYTLVRTIDEKLERLVAALLQNQCRQLDILERVNEINGLLVDLVG